MGACAGACAKGGGRCVWVHVQALVQEVWRCVWGGRAAAVVRGVGIVKAERKDVAAICSHRHCN